jgi:hypothetical protein
MDEAHASMTMIKDPHMVRRRARRSRSITKASSGVCWRLTRSITDRYLEYEA